VQGIPQADIVIIEQAAPHVNSANLKDMEVVTKIQEYTGC